MTRCEPWRLCPSAEIAPLLADETAAWLAELGWDVTTAWAAIEPARRAGRLPGFLARDSSGRTRGWTSFLLHRETLHVLAFSASDPDAAARLVRAVLESPEAGAARSVIFCVRSASMAWPKLLGSEGFQIEPYRYLSADLGAASPHSAPRTPHSALRTPHPALRTPHPALRTPHPALRTPHSALRTPHPALVRWRAHSDQAARLFARAYEGSQSLRAFAPHGTSDEWRDYVSGLVNGLGCGRFMPELSHVVERSADEIAAAIVVTDLGPLTAHVAQIAVDPAARGRGIGAELLRAAQRAAARYGFVKMTLLVAASNWPAVAIYEDLGFRDRAEFVVAVRPQPSLSTSFALATGGESTRL